MSDREVLDRITSQLSRLKRLRRSLPSAERIEIERRRMQLELQRDTLRDLMLAKCQVFKIAA